MARTPLKPLSDKTRRRNDKYRKVLPLQGKACWGCGGTPTDRHHIYELSEAPHMATELLNLLPVCRLCHSFFHDRGSWALREQLRVSEPGRMVVLDEMFRAAGKANMFRSWE